jgi:hypothetical protein
MNTGCRNTHIALIQCQYKDLGYAFVNAAQIGSSEVSCLSMKMKIVSKYLSMMYCYKTLATDLTYGYQFDVSELIYDEIVAIQAVTELSGVYLTSYDTETGYLYVYSTNVLANHAQVLGYIATITVEILPDVDIHLTPDFLLDLWNCITYTEFCNIINHAYSLTTL